MNEIKVFNGDIAVDDRGSLSFINDFDFKGVKRFYQVENNSKHVIRAFHGHLKEGKYVYVPKGAIIFAVVYLDDIKKPNKKNEVYRYILSEKKPKIIYVPPGYANGFRVLEYGTKILFFSTSTLKNSINDDYRYQYDYWGRDIWNIENR